MIEKDVVNHLELFIGKDTSKLSVTLKPYEGNHGQNGNEVRSYQERYHGLHPKFSLEHLKKILFNNHYNCDKKNYINDPIFFWDLMKKIQIDEKYMDILLDEKTDTEDVHTVDEDLIVTLLGRAVLKMATNVEIPLDISEAPCFLEDLEKYWLQLIIPEDKMAEIENYSTNVIHEILWKKRKNSSHKISQELKVNPIIHHQN
jgi:hypothetical protein